MVESSRSLGGTGLSGFRGLLWCAMRRGQLGSGLVAGTRIGNAGSGQTVSGERSRPECRLCQGEDCRPFHDDGRRYFRCPNCGLVFSHPECYLSAEDERAVYDRHQNSPDDSRYRQFLSRLFEPMAARLPSGSLGLDFGSGPGPTQSISLRGSNHLSQ